MNRDGKKVFLEVPMFLNYPFIETRLNEREFYKIVKEIEKNLGSTMKILQSDTQTILALTNDEKSLLELLLILN